MHDNYEMLRLIKVKPICDFVVHFNQFQLYQILVRKIIKNFLKFDIIIPSIHSVLDNIQLMDKIKVG